MDDHDTLDAARLAADRYHAARQDLFALVAAPYPDAFDELASTAEEFGAKHTQTLVMADPKHFGFTTDALATPEQQANLERCLGAFVNATDAMDAAVAEIEQGRVIPEADPVKVLALHGRLAELQMSEMTLCYADGGREPAPLTPVETRDSRELARSRPRGRGR
ncbi:MAG: hypothetical protein NW215_04005 [Hyphomicrobiales bacterium]|nr:hypothetical protein [Hyphomicrobiales bacterium]